MTYPIVGLFIIIWLFVGLISGLFCSFIDVKYKGFRFNWFDPFKLSFLGLIIFLWAPFFFIRSKNDKRLRNNRKRIFSTTK